MVKIVHLRIGSFPSIAYVGLYWVSYYDDITSYHNDISSAPYSNACIIIMLLISWLRLIENQTNKPCT